MHGCVTVRGRLGGVGVNVDGRGRCRGEGGGLCL